MKTLIRLGIAFAATAALALAINDYRGQLMDASCYNRNATNTGQRIWVRCAPTDATTAFAIHTEGRIRMLDPGGNVKAIAAVKGGYLKRDASGDFPVVIDGTRHGNTIQVEGIRARGSEVSVH